MQFEPEKSDWKVPCMFAFMDVNRRRSTPAHVVHQGECVIEIQTARDMSATAADSAVDARVCRVS